MQGWGHFFKANTHIPAYILALRTITNDAVELALYFEKAVTAGARDREVLAAFGIHEALGGDL